MTKRKRTSVPVVHDMARLERIAAQIRARPRDHAANNALTAGLNHDELIEVWRLIDAQAAAVQDAEAAQESMERRASYRRRPSRRRAAAPRYQLSFGVSLLGAVMMFALLAVSWRLSVLILAAVLLVRGWLWLCGRHPYVAIGVAGFLRGLLGGRR